MLFAEPLLSQYCEPEQRNTNISPITYQQAITVHQAVPVAVVPSGTIRAIEYVQPDGQAVTSTITTLSPVKGSKSD